MTHQQNVYKGTLCRRGMSEDREWKASDYLYGINRPFGPITKEQHLDDLWIMEMDVAMERAIERNEDYKYHLGRKTYY